MTGHPNMNHSAMISQPSTTEWMCARLLRDDAESTIPRPDEDMFRSFGRDRVLMRVIYNALKMRESGMVSGLRVLLRKYVTHTLDLTCHFDHQRPDAIESLRDEACNFLPNTM